MLVNPGGPGGSGLIYSVLGAFVPGDVGATYDWIGFDPPRGGRQRPGPQLRPELHGRAPTALRPDDVPHRVRLADEGGEVRDRLRGRSGSLLLGHLKTTDSVADMDAIRQFWAKNRSTSTGSRTARISVKVHATLHPNQVRRMVLDSNVDPRTGVVPSQPRPGPRLRPA